MSTPQQATSDAEVKQRVEAAREHAQRSLDASWPLGAGGRSRRLLEADPDQPQRTSPLPQTDIPHLLDIVAPLLDWCKHSQADLAAAASELPRDAWPLLYTAPPTAPDREESEEPGALGWDERDASELDGHYIVCIRVRDEHGTGDGVTFPLVVLPRLVAHTPWKPALLDEPLGTHRPERFAASPVLVKHALLVLLCDLLIRPFGLPPGSLSIDEQTNVCTYNILVPDDFDTQDVQLFVQTFLFEPRLCGSSDPSRKACLEQLKERDPACPVTLIDTDVYRECMHLIDKSVGPGLFRIICQGLHNEATRSGRYGDLLWPWEGHQWTGGELDQPINQVLAFMLLRKLRDYCAFLAVLEHPHSDEVVSDELLRYYDQWREPLERRTLPAYAYVNFDPSIPLLDTGNYERRAGPDTGNGLSTVWFPPDCPAHRPRAGERLSRPPHWFPAHAAFPPPFLMNNTVPARVVRHHRSYAVAGLASRIPRRRRCAFHGAVPRPAQDPASPQPSDTVALVAFAVLALAAAYAADDGDSDDSDSDSDLEAEPGVYPGWEDMDAELDSSVRVTEWLRSTPPGPDEDDGPHRDTGSPILPALACSSSEGRSPGQKRGAEDAAGDDQKRARIR